MSRRFGGRWQGAALMLALATTLLASCSAPGLPPLPWQARTPQPLPDAQQVLYVSMREGMRVADLDPRRLSDVRSDMAHVTPLLYSTLFTFDARLRPIHALASGYTVSADGLRYTFHLRSDARFADGAPITSREVAFSLQRLLDPCDGSGYAFVFFSLQGALTYTTQSCNASFPTLPTPLPLIGHALLTPDPSTLVIVLAQPDAALLAKLAEPYSGVVEQSVVQRYGDGWVKHLADGGGQGTSGMYAVASAQGVVNEGTQLTFVRASHYWGAAPRLREVIVRPYQSAIELASHGDDLVLGSGRSPEFVEPTQLPTLSKLPGYHHAPARDEDYLLLNPTSTGLTDPRARQALALALNRTALAALFGGVATNHLIPHNTGAYQAAPSGLIATAPLTGDVARAQALWQSYVADRCGGVASQCPPITLWYSVSDMVGADPFQVKFDHAVARQWQAAFPGIRITFSGVGGGLETLLTFVGRVSYFNFDEEYPDPQDWLSEISAPSATDTRIIHDPAADALVARAAATLDPTARQALYQQAENTLLDDAVVIPIAQEQDSWAAKPAVMNFPANPEPYFAPAAWARIYLTAPPGK